MSRSHDTTHHCAAWQPSFLHVVNAMSTRQLDAQTRVSGCPLVLLLPVFNDWESARLLLPTIGDTLSDSGFRAGIVLIDDGSTNPAPPDIRAFDQEGVSGVAVVRLRRNLGHQRAIAIGLALIREHLPDAVVVVMDADGEDQSSDIPRLLDRFCQGGAHEIVFAQRIRRTEGPVFRAFYWLYRTLHHALTGIKVQVGNFSVIPPQSLGALTVSSDLWNHFAATVFQSRLPYAMVPTARGKRLSGHSHMNYVSLVTHGLGAISVFSDRVGVRILIATAALLSLIVLSVAGALALWLVGMNSFPLWAAIVSCFVLLLLFQLCLAAGLFVLLVLFSRAGASFIPARDYVQFVNSNDCRAISDFSRL